MPIDLKNNSTSNKSEENMSQINFDIALYNSPFFENLVSELFRISKYKRNIYKRIRSEEEYSKKLSYEERSILKDLSEKENKILLEILVSKNWLGLPSESVKYFVNALGEKYDSNVYYEKEDYREDLI